MRTLLNKLMSKWPATSWYTSRLFILSSKPELLLLGFSLISLLTILITARIMAHFYYDEVCENFIVESVKILGGAVFAGVVALLVTNVWQQKSIGFEMLKELNSPEFFKVRNHLSVQKKIALLEGIDLDNIRHWFPDRVKSRGVDRAIKFYDENQFAYAHALPSMVYFVVRLSNYGRNGMLNVNATKNLFNVFFVHYQILLLEFANVFEKYYRQVYLTNINDYYVDAEAKNNMWLIRADDIRYFFHIIGLPDKLPDNHIYEFFSSMNGVLEESKRNKFVSEIDLNEYIKNYKKKDEDDTTTDLF